MSPAPQDKQNAAIASEDTASKDTIETEDKSQISDAQLENVTGGTNVQGSRLEEIGNQTVGSPASLEEIAEIPSQ